MAELSAEEGNSVDGKVRVKKRPVKIDMTPMVDLAFLLLTFFILTTTFNKPPILELTMPEDSPYPNNPPLINAANVLNLVLGENDKVYWWIADDPRPSVTNYSRNGIRKMLLKQRAVNPKIMVLIKAHDKSRYENIVDVLDEMTITRMERYALVDLTDEDMDVIASH